MGFSRTIAGLLITLAGLAGITLTDSTAVELAGIIVQLGGIGLAWYGRYRKGGITAIGTRTEETPP